MFLMIIWSIFISLLKKEKVCTLYYISLVLFIGY